MQLSSVSTPQFGSIYRLKVADEEDKETLRELTTTVEGQKELGYIACKADLELTNKSQPTNRPCTVFSFPCDDDIFSITGEEAQTIIKAAEKIAKQKGLTIPPVSHFVKAFKNYLKTHSKTKDSFTTISLTPAATDTTKLH